MSKPSWEPYGLERQRRTREGLNEVMMIAIWAVVRWREGRREIREQHWIDCTVTIPMREGGETKMSLRDGGGDAT